MEVEELEGPEVLRDLAATMLQALKEQFPCSQCGFATALMLMLRAEIDRGGVGRDFGLWMFQELLQLEVPAHDEAPPSVMPARSLAPRESQ